MRFIQILLRLRDRFLLLGEELFLRFVASRLQLDVEVDAGLRNFACDRGARLVFVESELRPHLFVHALEIGTLLPDVVVKFRTLLCDVMGEQCSLFIDIVGEARTSFRDSGFKRSAGADGFLLELGTGRLVHAGEGRTRCRGLLLEGGADCGSFLFECGVRCRCLFLNRGVCLRGFLFEPGMLRCSLLRELGVRRGRILLGLRPGLVRLQLEVGVRLSGFQLQRRSGLIDFAGKRRPTLGEFEFEVGVRLFDLSGEVFACFFRPAGQLGFRRLDGVRQLLVGGLDLVGKFGVGGLDLVGQFGAGRLDVARKVAALLLDVAREVAALLLDLPKQVATLLLVFALKLCSGLLRLAGKHRSLATRFTEFAVGDDSQLCDFALGLGPQRGSLPLGGCPRFSGLCGNGAADAGCLAQGILRDDLGFGGGAWDESGCLFVGTADYGGGPGGRFADQAICAIHSFGLQLRDLGLHRAAQLLGIDVGLTDQPRRLLFGNSQRILELGAESAVCGASGLFQLGLKFGDGRGKPLDLLGRLGLVAVGFDDLAAQVLECAVDLFAVIAAHYGAERFVVSGHGALLYWLSWQLMIVPYQLSAGAYTNGQNHQSLA